MNRRRRLVCAMVQAGAVAAAMQAITPALAQGYPSRSVKIVVPFGPGAAADVAARRVAVGIAAALGQPVVVENRPGAGGSIAAEYVARAPADGYTLLAGTINTHAFNPGLYKTLPYNPLQSFEPISRFVSFSNVLLVPNSLNVSTVKDLVELAGRSGKPLTFSSMGTGQSGHLAGELLAKGIGKPLLHVPYKDVGQYVPDTLDGRVDMSFGNIPTFIANINTGKVKAIAVSSSTRLPILPNVPTLEEAGIKGQEMSLWVGLFAPKGTPAPILAQLNQATRKALESPEIVKGFESEGSTIEKDATPAAFRSYVEAEHKRWHDVMLDAGIQPQ